MQINDALTAGVRGFQDATARVSQAAQQIASHSVTDASVESVDQNDLVSSLVDLKVAEIDALANAKVIKTASDLVGNLLDVTA